jgi:uncharacterized protein
VDAQRELARISARALGVATEPDIGDYFRMPRAVSKARVAELVESGELLPVSVEGWTSPAFLWHEASSPSLIEARALLSPLDSLIWTRERTSRLFGFDYRLEIYTPAAKRVHGYYVLPFLLGEALVTRVDLESDRKAGVLVAQAAHGEPQIDEALVAAGLSDELRLVASWLDLPAIEVEPVGGLAGRLADDLADRSR